jgi:hypothetical protein
MSETGRTKFRARQTGGWAAALAIVAVGALCGGPAEAWQVYKGEKFDARLDSTFTTGAAMRVQGTDSQLIYKGNDPRNPNVGSTGSFFTNADDGNLNYDKGDVYSAAVKGTFELQTNYQADWEYLPSIGSFFRASTFYDFVGNDRNSTQRTDLSEAARHRHSVIDGGVVGAQWIFLDMYADGKFAVLDHEFSLRAGNQVLNWGEAIFNPGGINSTSAFDVTKLRIPGSELREGLVPAPIIRVSGEVLPGFGLEGYYQLAWNRTNVDPTGSYWATNDMVGEGAEGLFFGNDPGGTGLSAEELIAQGRGIPRRLDDKPSHQGQGGVAMRYYWDRILTEFGLYYLRYHSKTPVVGTVAQSVAPKAYYRQYVGDIDLVGASFAREVLNATLAGEVAYVPNDPSPIVSQGEAMALSLLGLKQGYTGPVTARGYQRDERVQGTLNMIQAFGPSTRLGVGPLVKLLGADNFSLTSELAVAHYPSLGRQCSWTGQPFFDAQQGKSTDCVPYAGVGPSEGNDTPDPIIHQFPYKSDVNATSWGYQNYLMGEYTDPFGIPITVNPTLGWRHDFRGTTPNQTFIENRKAVSLGVALDYLQIWGANLGYTNFFGGGRKDLVADRDFVSVSFSYRY